MKLGNGEINFGSKESITWDTSVKTTKLSPEQLERLKTGEKLEDILTGKEEVTIEKHETSKILEANNVWKKNQEKVKVKKEIEVKGNVWDLTKELYIGYKKEGYTDADIMQMYHINTYLMDKFKKKHDLIGKFIKAGPVVEFVEELTPEKYVELKEQGVSDADVRKQFKLGTNTLVDFKNKHNLNYGRGYHMKNKNDHPVKVAAPITERVEAEPVVKNEPMKIEGVGKDAPTIVNDQGGKQSKVLYRFDLLDPKAMFEMTRVLETGAQKYGTDNWRLISVQEHLNHMIIHAYAYLAGDMSDEHLSHIMCRAMFAQGVELQHQK